MNSDLDKLLGDVELLVLDVDGVLTDGRLLYGADGEIGKAFNVKDGYGLRQLMKHGVAIAVISARPSAGALARLSELGLKHIYLACDDKVAQIRKLQASLAIDERATAVVGDDIPDLAMMGAAAVRIAPLDAVTEIREQAHWVTSLGGGAGAVREVCDAIIKAKNSSA